MGFISNEIHFRSKNIASGYQIFNKKFNFVLKFLGSFQRILFRCMISAAEILLFIFGTSLLLFCHFPYFFYIYIILYFNSPRRIKSKDFLQFIFFHSPHRPKPKDFLQLILMIFLLWISFKKHEEIRFLRQISFNAPHQVDQIYPRAVDELPPCPPLKSPNLVFRVKITVLYLFSGSSV